MTVEDMEPGDFLYEAENELFLVAVNTNENEIEFAAHGWRTIDKDRLESYLDAEKPVLQTEEQVRAVVEEADDENAEDKLSWLTDIFETYEKELPDSSEHDEFALDDT